MARKYMKDVMKAFLSGSKDKVNSNWHKTENGRYFYKGYCLAELTDAELIINPNSQRWPRTEFHGNYAQQLLYKFINNNKNNGYYWGNDDNEYPYVCNRGWGYAYPAIEMSGPLVIDRQTLKIKKEINKEYVIEKLNRMSNTYRVNHILNCCKHFDIAVPDKVANKLVPRVLKNNTWGLDYVIGCLFKLPITTEHIELIKNKLKKKIEVVDRVRNIDDLRATVEKYFTKETAPDVYEVLMPKWVVLHLEGK